MREDVRWTNLTQERIAEGLAEVGTPVSVPVVKQLLDRHGFVRRKARKSTAMGHHPDQDAQFQNIARLKDEFWGSTDPILSMESVELVRSLIERVVTRTGLSVLAEVQKKAYQTGRKVAEGFRQGMRIVFDSFLPRWNYRVVPTRSATSGS